MGQRALDIVYWRDVQTAALLAGTGAVFFFTVGVLGWSSLGTASIAVAAHTFARLVYYNTVGVRPTPPAEWISEEEMHEKVASFTEAANLAAHTLFALACGVDPVITMQWIGGLVAVGILCRLLGTTGFL